MGLQMAYNRRSCKRRAAAEAVASGIAIRHCYQRNFVEVERQQSARMHGWLCSQLLVPSSSSWLAAVYLYHAQQQASSHGTALTCKTCRIGGLETGKDVQSPRLTI
jgi:hypothetical protein